MRKYLTMESNQLSAIQEITFLGLGVMGYPMAGHLARGFARVHALVSAEGSTTSVTPTIKVYNRTSSKAKKWIKEYESELKSICPNIQIVAAQTIAQAAAPVVAMCVGGDPDLRMIAFGQDDGQDDRQDDGQGLIECMPEGALLIDHTTASAQVAREIFTAAQEKNIGFVDAPISGGQIGAEQGTLAIMCGGDEADFSRAKPIMELYGKKVVHIGPVGSGQTAKMINQICISGLLQGLSEGLAFGKKAGLNMDKVLEVISSGAASSWQMQHRSHTMLEGRYDFGFAVKWMIKDLKIALAEGKHIGANCEITEEVLKRYEEIAKAGGNSYDTSSLMTLTDTNNQL